MPDVYATITEVDPAVVEQVANAMEVSATDPQQQAMVGAYLADLAVPAGARVLEIGCGTGAICRLLAARPEVAEVLGVDPSPVLLARGRELAASLKAEARRRVAANAFFGHVAYASLTARKPDDAADCRSSRTASMEDASRV